MPHRAIGASPYHGLEFFNKFLQLLGVDIANGPEIETLLGPEFHIESFGRLRPYAALRAGAGADEQIEHVDASSVDDDRHRPPIDVIEPAADQREALRRQV